ncbi:hypothetical protein BHE74_00041113 [Ensete ventricosum]|nr:hypothetical protein GW17_00057516 [Ensete ventricosum]RWW52462.1 hypothetical protein BHE74_00041113 [Ensete ventricosum]
MIVLQAKPLSALLPVRSAAMEKAAAAASPLSALFSHSPSSHLRSAPGFRLLPPSLPLADEIHAPSGTVLLLPPRRFCVSARSSGDQIVARPSSSEMRKNPFGGCDRGAGDEKLRALRELFSRPDVGIDAYIIPSQDAHQVVFVNPCKN